MLNKPEFQGASILLAQDNFGCGSSREHAVWALAEFGFRVVLAPSFADIFFSNCFKSGVLPVVLDKAVIDGLFDRIRSEGGLELTVDLEAREIRTDDGEVISFEVDSFRRNCLLEGLDDIGVTLEDADAIRAYETRRREQAPWLFDAIR